MDGYDRALLKDIAHFTYLNHVASAYIFRTRLNTVEDREDIAVYALHKYRTYSSREAALADARENKDTVRVERVICARIYAEFIAACEDLGGLGFAVKHREKIGLFQRYLKSQPSEVAQFFDQVKDQDVPSDEAIGLDTLLNLPSPASLRGKLSQEELTTLQQSYRAQALNLHTAATLYRQPGIQVTQLSTGTPLQPGWEEDINVLLDVWPAGSTPDPRKGVLVNAYNKIKHRFTVTERLNEYTDPNNGRRIEYGRFSLQAVDQIFENTVSIAGTIAEIAATLLWLDGAAIPL